MTDAKKLELAEQLVRAADKINAFAKLIDAHNEEIKRAIPSIIKAANDLNKLTKKIKAAT